LHCSGAQTGAVTGVAPASLRELTAASIVLLTLGVAATPASGDSVGTLGMGRALPGTAASSTLVFVVDAGGAEPASWIVRGDEEAAGVLTVGIWAALLTTGGV
jgi:hypothetical protein